MFVQENRAASKSTPDEYLHRVMWILQLKHILKNILILLTSHKYNHLLLDLRKIEQSTLLMYEPRLSQSCKNLLHDPRSQKTGQLESEEAKVSVQCTLCIQCQFQISSKQNIFSTFRHITAIFRWIYCISW